VPPQRAGSVAPDSLAKCGAARQVSLQVPGPDEKTRKAKLRLDVLPGLSSEAIVPGKPDASALVGRIFAADCEWCMPPFDQDGSHQQQKELSSGGSEPALATSSTGRSSHKVSGDPDREGEELAAQSDRRLCPGRLEKEGSSRRRPPIATTLIRRLSLDLLGLPATPAEVDAFVKRHRDNAYEKVVDRLLASEHLRRALGTGWLDLLATPTPTAREDRPRHLAISRLVIRGAERDMPSISSRSSRSPATCCRNPTPEADHRNRLPPPTR